MSLMKNFIHKTEDSGRFIVTSIRTGRKYFVEAIGDPHNTWGSIDQASGKLNVKKGWKRFKGSIESEDSLITKENGFDKIYNLKAGDSPLVYINKLDEKYPTKI